MQDTEDLLRRRGAIGLSAPRDQRLRQVQGAVEVHRRVAFDGLPRGAAWLRRNPQRLRISRRSSRDLEHVRSDLDQIADVDRARSVDALAVHERAVLASEIRNLEMPSDRAHDSMLPGREGVVHHDGSVARAAEDDLAAANGEQRPPKLKPILGHYRNRDSTCVAESRQGFRRAHDRSRLKSRPISLPSLLPKWAGSQRMLPARAPVRRT